MGKVITFCNKFNLVAYSNMPKGFGKPSLTA